MTRTKYNGRRRRRTPWVWLVALALIITAGVYWFQWQCWGVETTVTQVELSGLPAEFDGFRIAQLSDLHGHEYGEGNSDLLEMVREQNPDLIVLTGDLVDQ